MAYADPALIRDHVVKIRLNDNEAATLRAAADAAGMELAAYCRETAIRLLRERVSAALNMDSLS